MCFLFELFELYIGFFFGLDRRALSRRACPTGPPSVDRNAAVSAKTEVLGGTKVPEILSLFEVFALSSASHVLLHVSLRHPLLPTFCTSFGDFKIQYNHHQKACGLS